MLVVPRIKCVRRLSVYRAIVIFESHGLARTFAALAIPLSALALTTRAQISDGSGHTPETYELCRHTHKAYQLFQIEKCGDERDHDNLREQTGYQRRENDRGAYADHGNSRLYNADAIPACIAYVYMHPARGCRYVLDYGDLGELIGVLKQVIENRLRRRVLEFTVKGPAEFVLAPHRACRSERAAQTGLFVRPADVPVVDGQWSELLAELVESPLLIVCDRAQQIAMRHAIGMKASVEALDQMIGQALCRILDHGYLSRLKRWQLALQVGQTVMSGSGCEPVNGNSMPLSDVPVGLQIHNIELHPGKGCQLCRTAGGAAQLTAREGDYAVLQLSSGELRLVHVKCRATIGRLGNLDHQNVKLGKAGRKRHMGRRPEVRGGVMNPRHHPHGGGEGKSPTGMPPKTPWGKPAMGLVTRRRKTGGGLIVRSRRRKS